MFKKRERPTAARSRDVEGEGEGEAGAVPIVNKKVRFAAVAGSSSAGGGLIGASTKRTESDLAAARADKYGDSALSGFKADDSTSARPRPFSAWRLAPRPGTTPGPSQKDQEIHEGLKEGVLETGVYRGLGGYKQYAERSESAISNSKYSESNTSGRPAREVLARTTKTQAIVDSATPASSRMTGPTISQATCSIRSGRRSRRPSRRKNENDGSNAWKGGKRRDELPTLTMTPRMCRTVTTAATRNNFRRHARNAQTNGRIARASPSRLGAATASVRIAH